MHNACKNVSQNKTGTANNGQHTKFLNCGDLVLARQQSVFYYNAAAFPEKPRYVRLGATISKNLAQTLLD
jgi:hypothetical protein